MELVAHPPQLEQDAHATPPGPRAVARSSVLTPLDMLNQAVSQGASIEVIERMMALWERWDAAQNRKAFDAAMSKAKAAMPAIVKDKLVSFGAGKTSYKHETLDKVLDVVRPVLNSHGLDVRFRTESQPGSLTVICRLIHDDGHTEENSLTAPVDASGSKNAIQAIGSAQTYLQRYTLKAALGLAAAEDDDGHAISNGHGASNGSTITDQQAHRLMDLANDVGADVPKLCAYLKIPSIPELPAKRFDDAVKALEAKRRRA